MSVGIVWAVLLIAAYLLGTFPTAILVAGTKGVDPTKSGSGNPGASNVYRTAGRKAGLVTLLGDVAKGAIAAGAGWLADGRHLAFACVAAAVVGHIFPVTRRFRGGKGVATAGGGVIVLSPLVAAICLVVFAVLTKTLKKASVGSLAICVLVPVLHAVVHNPGWETLWLAGICALVIARHAGNIKRLLAGSERSL